MASGIVGLGAYVPDRVITNADIAHWCGASPDWIVEKTGITERRYAAKDARTSDLGVAAAKGALAAVPPESVELVILATSTPDQPIPATAAMVADKLGLSGSAAVDVNAVCSGFVYALAMGARMLTGEENRYALVIAADMYSRIMNRADRTTVSLFGDGAGAVLLGRVPDGYGVLSYSLTSDGSLADLVEVTAGGTRQPVLGPTDPARYFVMRGREVLAYAEQYVPKMAADALSRAGVSQGDIARVIIHQGNPVMVRRLTSLLGFASSQVPVVGDLAGNAAAASVPMTLWHSHVKDPIQRGDHVLLLSVGGGMNAAAAVVRWW